MLGSKTFHFVAWTVLALALVGTLGWMLRPRAGPATALARANAVVGPFLPGLFWLFGIVFNPPRNFSVAEHYGFFGYWFQLHDASPERYQMHQDVLVSLVVVGLVLLTLGAILAFRCWRDARGSVLPGIALVLWYLAGHALRYVPDRMLEIFLYEVDTSLGELLTGSAYAPVQQGFNTEALFPGALGFSLACVAAVLTWRSARRG